MEFTKVIAERISCKKFDGRPVEPAQLDAILAAGRLAPTGRNLQEQRIYVAQSAEAFAKIDRATPCRYNAGTCLVVAFDKNKTFNYPGGKYCGGPEDATIVATHMMLAATDAGVSSCWINFFDPDVLAAELGLPENEQIVMLLDLGYPAPDAPVNPMHTKRKPLSETVSYL